MDEANAVPSSVSQGFLCLVSTIFDNYRPQLTPCIKCNKWQCQARALLLPVLQADKMSASNLSVYFSSNPRTFGFHASLPPDNITVDTANKRTNQSF